MDDVADSMIKTDPLCSRTGTLVLVHLSPLSPSSSLSSSVSLLFCPLPATLSLPLILSPSSLPPFSLSLPPSLPPLLLQETPDSSSKSNGSRASGVQLYYFSLIIIWCSHVGSSGVKCPRIFSLLQLNPFGAHTYSTSQERAHARVRARTRRREGGGGGGERKREREGGREREREREEGEEGEKELIPKWQHAPVCLFNRLVDVV